MIYPKASNLVIFNATLKWSAHRGNPTMKRQPDINPHILAMIYFWHLCTAVDILHKVTVIWPKTKANSVFW